MFHSWISERAWFFRGAGKETSEDTIRQLGPDSEKTIGHAEAFGLYLGGQLKAKGGKHCS